ncbi:MAG: FAD:protein FMN transferase [Pseudomonadota bacterium]
MMGTQYRVLVVADQCEDESAQANLHDQLLAEMNRVNAIMSHYIDDSELSTINKAPADQEIELSPDMAAVMLMSAQIFDASNGVFDVTLSPVIELWGFGKDGAVSQQPSEQELQQVAETVGFEKLNFLSNSLNKEHSDLQINLSAIAKGYAIDAVGELLDRLAFENYMIDIGGELKLSGHNKERGLWRIAIEQPNVLGGIQSIISISETAVATSGDYRNFIELDGQKYSHTLSSETLSPVLHSLASVTVLHQSAAMADGFATAIMAKGEGAGIEFAKQQNLSYYAMVRQENQGYEVLMSDDMRRFLVPELDTEPQQE